MGGEAEEHRAASYESVGGPTLDLVSILQLSDEQVLRARVSALLERASVEQLQMVGCYLEVNEVAEEYRATVEPTVPESLIRPSDEELSRQLTESRARGERVSSEQMYREVLERLA